VDDEARPVKVYRVVLMVVDHDGLGRDGVIQAMENVRYPNRCLSPRVAHVDEREVPWTDGHPLNKRDGWVAFFKGLFL
jgi:hypothetical protein